MSGAMDTTARNAGAYLHTIGVVIPVYRGEHSLEALLAEIEPFFEESVTAAGHCFVVREVVLVHDHGPDRSDVVIRRLAAAHPQVHPIWLARNFGQHAATVAGIASTTSAWVATIDEDGQHAPADIARLLDRALDGRHPLVYGRHAGKPPHAKWRNVSSKIAHRLARMLGGADLAAFTSFRLVLGSHARSIAAYCGPRTYLDSALSWGVSGAADVEVSTRAELREGSGYTFSRLLSHFWSLVLSTGTRPLRIVSGLGFTSAIVGVVGAVVAAVARLQGNITVPGWTSVTIVLLVSNGLVLLALGVVAEYVGQLLKSAQGRPLYIMIDDPALGPLGDRE